MVNDLSDTKWMNALRAIAVSGVVVHHFLLFIPFDPHPKYPGLLAAVTRAFGGICVHLFFLLSGCGLAISYLRQEDFSFRVWAKRRFQKIVAPYWIIVTCTVLLANLAYMISGISEDSFSWGTLFSHISFTRNQYQPSWGLNPTLWFMPVIIGLYAVFPFLMRILRKRRMGQLLVLSALITYGSICSFHFLGYEIEHQSAIFLFFILEFSMGISIGNLVVSKPQRLVHLLGAAPFTLGFFLLALSFQITHMLENGGLYNDPITAAGVFLITMNMWNLFLRPAGEKISSLLNEVSRVSYIMYLIHGALILYVAAPLLRHSREFPLNPILSLALGALFLVFVFGFARALYGPTMALATLGKRSPSVVTQTN